MTTFKIMLSSINDVKNFVNIVNKYEFDIDLISERYVVALNQSWVYSV